VTQAIYDSGFNSSGRVYDRSGAILGMTPTQHRAGGARAVIRFAVGECSLGSILVAASDRGVCAILLGDDPAPLVRDLQDRFPELSLRRYEVRTLGSPVSWRRPRRGLDLPLDVRGTRFRKRLAGLRGRRRGTYRELCRSRQHRCA
jgi:AraC family transcriptional regulator of adaptative response/methylated-DNA-[protein]-cysteine methyltransferase